MRRLNIPVICVIAALSLAFCTPIDAAQKKNIFHKTPPDLTQGGKPDDAHDWSLGPIGANGWVFNRRPHEGASSLARQILITWIQKDGPAAGKLQLNDVIIGIATKKFTRDARKALGDAINKAETEKYGGRLPLLVWRKGKEQKITVQLKVMGSYSKTMPFNCAKTDKIIDMACEHVKKKPLKPDWLGYIDGLGLMATGRKDVMPKVKEFAHSLVVPGETLSIQKHVPMKCWHWSYKLLFLSEYYLRTKDSYVFPTIKEYATKLSMGQSGAGTWGHTYAAIENTGYMHGNLGGYGAINQQGLTVMLGLVLADKCGVKHPELRQAIVRGNNFFKFFIGKGTIPYGDHGAAKQWYDDNGKSGSAAILFDLLGNRKGAEFFADMVLGSAPSGREAGHTGCFWSHLWGGVGASRGGELGLTAFLTKMNWAFTLERQPDGHMVFQGNAGEGGDTGKPKTKWDCTGARLLQLCVPRRVLYITGKQTPKSSHLKRERIEQIFAAGRLDSDPEARKAIKQSQILKLLEDPLPPTRHLAANILAERNINCVDKLLTMLDSSSPNTRYGAAEALSMAGFGSKRAADKLIAMMKKDDDVLFKTYAIDALVNRDKQRGLLSVAKPAIPVLLKMAVKPSPDDPRKVLQHDIGRALFYAGRAQRKRGLLPEYGLDDTSRPLLVPAVKEILTNENGWARSTMGSWIYPKLTDVELNQLWGDIYQATRYIAPSGIMFASGIRTQGLHLMADHHIKEGLDLCAWYIRYQKGHGNKRRVPDALKALMKYGAHAKKVIPELEKHADWYAKQRGRGKVAPDDPANAIRAAIKKIKAIKGPPKEKLVSIAKYIKPHKSLTP